MSNDIKEGDLVMVVKPMPCCGNASGIGYTFIAGKIVNAGLCVCHWCKATLPHDQLVALRPDGLRSQLRRLKKIDPPEEGDSLPTRRDLEVPA